jgi:hypothetical protein
MSINRPQNTLGKKEITKWDLCPECIEVGLLLENALI